jgi:hypothetical protein
LAGFTLGGRLRRNDHFYVAAPSPCADGISRTGETVPCFI